MIYDDGEDCVVTLHDHDGLENDDAVNEIYHAVKPMWGGPSALYLNGRKSRQEKRQRCRGGMACSAGRRRQREGCERMRPSHSGRNCNPGGVGDKGITGIGKNGYGRVFFSFLFLSGGAPRKDWRRKKEGVWSEALKPDGHRQAAG